MWGGEGGIRVGGGAVREIFKRRGGGGRGRAGGGGEAIVCVGV